jgi:hypothetical protein
MKIPFLCFILVVGFVLSHEPPKPKRKKHNQELKQKSEPKPADTVEDFVFSRPSDALFSLDSFATLQKRESVDIDPPLVTVEKAHPSTCPPCEGPSKIGQAIDYFWRNDLMGAYACACNHLLQKRSDGFAQSIQHSLSQTKYFSITNIKNKFETPTNDPPAIKTWEVLGPINVGKLEVDADSTFISPLTSTGSLDVAQHILSMPLNASVFSELVLHGQTGWRSIQAKKTGEVNMFNIQSLSFSRTDLLG